MSDEMWAELASLGRHIRQLQQLAFSQATLITELQTEVAKLRAASKTGWECYTDPAKWAAQLESAQDAREGEP